MHVNRGLVFWGIALIMAGAVALAVQSGTLDESVAREAWRWWPAVLIVIGLAVIAARTPFALAGTTAAGLVVGGMAGTLVAGWPGGIGIGCGGEPTEVTTEQGGFTGGADVRLRLNCGELDVSTAAGSAWSVNAAHPDDAAPEIRHDGGSLVVSADDGGFIGFARARHAWDVTLPTDRALDLEIDVNAASSRLDLADADLTRFRMSANAGEVLLTLGGARVADLSIEANAGSVSVATDSSTRLDGSIGMNAGSLELCVPDGVGIEIVLDDPNVTFSHNLDDGRGFSRDGDSWRLGDGSAIRLEIDGNATSFTFNPDGGCS